MLLKLENQHRKYLDWCFHYILTHQDNTKRYQWIDRLNFNEIFSILQLQEIFYQQGYQLEIKKLIYPNLYGPSIITLDDLDFVVLLDWRDDLVFIEHPIRGKEQISWPRQNNQYLEMLIIEPIQILFCKHNLITQIRHFVINKFFSKQYLGGFLMVLLFIYELFSLIEPVLLNLIIEHMDLFGSYSELVLPFFLLF